MGIQWTCYTKAAS